MMIDTILSLSVFFLVSCCFQAHIGLGMLSYNVAMLSWQLYKFRLEQYTTNCVEVPWLRISKNTTLCSFVFVCLHAKTSAVQCVVCFLQYMRLSVFMCVCYCRAQQMDSVVLYWVHCDSLPDWHHMADCFVVGLQQSAINSAPNPHCHHSSWLQFSLLYLLLLLHRLLECDS